METNENRQLYEKTFDESLCKKKQLYEKRDSVCKKRRINAEDGISRYKVRYFLVRFLRMRSEKKRFPKRWGYNSARTSISKWIMAIMENDSGKKKCRLSNAKAKQIDSFQTYRRIIWHLTIAVWSFRTGVKMVTILEKIPG